VRIGRSGALALGVVVIGALGLGAAVAIQSPPNGNETAALVPDAALANETAPAAKSAPKPAAPPLSKSDTPMAERVAVIGILNKRDGVSRDVTMRPGEAKRIGSLIVRLRACDQTADWEPEQLTGAFIQADLHGSDGQWRRIFSGWLYKESPSLNVVENPYWDVWPKSCTMRHAETGPATVVAGSSAAAPSASSAKKSADPAATKPAAEAVEPKPSAASNSTT
jgi:hypothetical protein